MNRSEVKALLVSGACAMLIAITSQIASAQDSFEPRAIMTAPKPVTAAKPRPSASAKLQAGAGVQKPQADAGASGRGLSADVQKHAAARSSGGESTKPQPPGVTTQPRSQAEPKSAAASGGQNQELAAASSKPVPGADVTASMPQSSAVAPKPAGKPYFIEFRARSAQSYGHTFAVHGRVGQKITKSQVVGLHPATESPIPWMIGHFVIVPSETGASDGDTEDQYVIARYRILLSEPEYRKVTAYMKKLQTSSPVWHAVLYNCNAFVADIAKSMGLRTPGSTMLMPKEFISTLRDLNSSPKQAAAPVRSSAR